MGGGLVVYSAEERRHGFSSSRLFFQNVMRIIPVLAVLLVFVAAVRLASQAAGTGARTGLLETNTLFAVYGRGFDVAPILGRLGAYQNIDAMAADTQSWIKGISAVNDGKGVVTSIHLIYALAVPCTHQGDCLDYLGGDIVAKYIQPAAERGWVVVLDTQLGRSDPVEQVQHMIQEGYLKYDNVHVAIDPEFHTRPGQPDPGTPIGTVTAREINQAQETLDRYVENENLRTKKILIVHQFGDPTVHDGVPFMIQDKKTLQSYPNVELVIDADGLGTPLLKVRKYNLMTDSRVYPFLRFRGIKIFFPNRWERRGHFDKPPMTLNQIFGLTPVDGGLRMATQPNVVIIA